MFIIEKTHSAIYNLDFSESLFINHENTVKIRADKTASGEIGRYGSTEEARIAMEIIAEKIRLGNGMIYAPTDDEVKAKFMNANTPYRHRDGRKTKGHGGS